MELRHLRYFVAVAEALSFTKAAENLHLAQPSLTRQIKDLETEIGVQLFDRSGKRITLTQEGEYFLLEARRILAECAQSVQTVRRLSQGEASQLNIGYIANIYHDLLPATLGAFRKKCPRTALNLFDLTPAEQFRALDERRIDLGFVCSRARSTRSDLHWACVGHDIVLAAVAAGNPLAKKTKIDLKDLEPLFFVGMSEKTYPGSNEWLINACREAGFTPRIVQGADREAAVISFVAAGLGVALVPEQIRRLPHEGVIFRPLQRRLSADAWAVWNVNHSSDCLKQYIQIVKELS
ncbi:MAG TPA: LysR substrate-binding domain-containing protein [Chthoniobacterales bacterium]|jgi:DNA-binding transcriptional LysR family regulator|nr:LysR substrate-binding domain-containing protein [Chthoniobacterales bacterium]